MINIDYSYEIADCLEEAFKGDTEYLLSLLKDLYDGTGDAVFESRIERICKDEELCRECFSELAVYPTYEVIGEYMGIPAVETVWNRRCKECGRRY